MDYEKINWKNQPNKQTPINATNLNYMDDGIYEAHERINANSIISTAQGETILVTDSAKVPPENIKLFGKTTQVSTDGNQLLSIPDKTETRNGLTFTIVDGTCTIKGTPTNDTLCWFLGGYDNSNTIFTLPPGNYYIKDCRIWSFDGTTRVNKTGALTLTENFNVTGVYTETYTSGTVVNTTIYPMINKGLAALPFEPYTGGKPSPSIDYPQELNSCGDDGSINHALLGANLYNIYDKLQYNFQDCTIDNNDWCSVYYDNSDGDTTHYVGIQVKPSKYLKQNTEYLIVTETEYISGCDFYQVSGMEQATTQGQFINTFSVSNPGIQVNKITTRNDFTGCVTMLRSIVAVNPGNICKLKYRISVLADLSVTTNTFVYEPYTEQTLTELTPNGLPGIPVSDTSIANYIDETGQAWVADYVDLERGKLVHMVAQEIIEGTPVFSETNVSGRFVWTRALTKTYKNADEYALSNFAKYNYWGVPNQMGDVFAVHGAYGNKSLYYAPSAQMTADEVNTKFAEMIASDNPPVIVGQLAEPFEADLTSEELAQYKSLCMNYPNTTITNDAGAYMEVEYVASPKEYIANLEKKHDNDIQQLKTAIIALGGTI